MKKFYPIIIILIFAFLLAGCGKTEDEVRYEVVDGKIVEVHSSEKESGTSYTTSGNFQTESQYNSNNANAALNGQNANAGDVNVGVVSDGVAMDFADEEYNSISKADKTSVEELKNTMMLAADACRETYVNADKGEGINVTLSNATVSQMVSDIGSIGISCIDYLGNCNMSSYEQLDDFGKSIYTSSGLISGTYLIVYQDGHLTGCKLTRSSGIWHLISVSGEWEVNNSLRIFSEGQYSVGGVSYTNKGYLIYSRNTEDFDDNQKKNTGSYTMVRVLPYDYEARSLAAKYIEPISYLENNLFTTSWTQADFGPIDFNSLYAYLFGMYHGTEMLSSYNVRNYYKSYGGTRLYLVPTDSFETVVGTYFNIDSYALRNISDFSYSAGGYFFLGYNRDYYSEIPRTPSAEVVSYQYNSDGSITMVVDAINEWYGTDKAFEHILTVMPTKSGFKYVSNEFIESEDNIVPSQKLSEMLDVEMKKLG